MFLILEFQFYINLYLKLYQILVFIVIFVLCKAASLPFPDSVHVSQSIFELIHSDVWDPYQTPSLDGS